MEVQSWPFRAMNGRWNRGEFREPRWESGRSVTPVFGAVFVLFGLFQTTQKQSLKILLLGFSNISKPILWQKIKT